MTEVIALRFDIAETRAAEPMQLEAERLIVLGEHFEDVRLLPDANLPAHAHNQSTIHECFDGEIVVAEVGDGMEQLH